jgi:hypothetical protein
MALLGQARSGGYHTIAGEDDKRQGMPKSGPRLGSGNYAMSSLIPVLGVEGNAPDVSRLIQFDTAT